LLSKGRTVDLKDVTPLIVAIIGATVAVTTALVAAIVAVRNEQKSRRGAAHREELKELRLRVADVFTELFILQHEMEWLTWHAKYHPEAIDLAMIGRYEATVHAALPKALGAMAIVASLDLELYLLLKPLAEEVYFLEGGVALAAKDLGTDREGSIAKLTPLTAATTSLYVKLPIELGTAMEKAGYGDDLRT
jgi:hypothetical protein